MRLVMLKLWYHLPLPASYQRRDLQRPSKSNLGASYRCFQRAIRSRLRCPAMHLAQPVNQSLSNTVSRTDVSEPRKFHTPTTMNETELSHDVLNPARVPL